MLRTRRMSNIMSMSYDDCRADLYACDYNGGYQDGYDEGYEQGLKLGKEEGYRKIALFLIRELMDEN